MKRPASVAIDDLAAPRFPDEALPIREAMADMGADIALEPDLLMAAAVEQAGVDDFGDAAFREPLQVVCTALSLQRPFFGAISTLGAALGLVWFLVLQPAANTVCAVPSPQFTSIFQGEPSGSANEPRIPIYLRFTAACAL